MNITHLELQQFRNLYDQELSFPSRVSVILGKNGHGKTSLLEAVYLLSQAKSFRRGTARNFVRWNSEPKGHCSVTGKVETQEGYRSICYRVVENRRRVFVNDERVSKAEDFYGTVRAVSFVPSDLELVSGAPLARRQFVDRILSLLSGSYIRESVSYQRALKQRHALLAQAPTPEKLEPWNQLLIQHGLAIAKQRLEILGAMAPLFRKYYSHFSGEPQEGQASNLQYRSSFVCDEGLRSQAKIEELFRVNTKVDIRTKKTSQGIHRDDVRVEFKAGTTLRAARGTASQGQTRSLTLAMKFAALSLIKERTGDAPILLLDDVESELDLGRRRALYELLGGFDGQVLVTATELSEEGRSCLKDALTYQVENGKVSCL